MKHRQVLIRAVEAVTFLFTAFSGFLKGIAPPEAEMTVFAVGTASLLTLCIFLVLSGRSTKRPGAERTLRFVGGALSVVAAAAALLYFHNLDRLTFGYPPERPEVKYIAGTEYSPDAAKLVAANNFTPPVLVAKFGGPQFKDLVWTTASIQRSRTILISSYLLFVLSVAGAIFTLMEGQTTAGRDRAGSTGRGRRKRPGTSVGEGVEPPDK
jgi:O-antigen ligase